MKWLGARLVSSVWHGRVAQLVRALLSHSRGPGFESLRAHEYITGLMERYDPLAP